MVEKVRVTFCDGTQKEYQKGIQVIDIYNDYGKKLDKDSESPVMVSVINGKLKELFEKVEHDSYIEFIDLSHVDGFRVYIRSVSLMLIRSIYDVMGKENVNKVLVKHSINKGIYFEIDSSIDITEEILDKIQDNMTKIVEQDLPINKRTVPLDEAMEFFEENKMYDKLKLFKYRRISSVNLYKLGWFEDYLYGYMAPSTGCLKYFKVISYADGLILQMPSRIPPHDIVKYQPLNKLFNIFQESKEWSKILEVDTVGALNDTISNGNIGELINVSEALQEKKIAEIADMIVKNKTKTKVVLIAGPSSSGKTTFAHRLSIQLKVNGLRPHPISIDDYFVDRGKTPLDENGNYDFESLYAIDLELFNNDLSQLLQGEKVELPTFNFKTGIKEYKGNFLKLKEDDILVVEGIHGLNEKLTSTVSRDKKFKIYISALTQLSIDQHNRIPTTDVRLLRRIVRDKRYRGASAAKTIKMWQSVRRGEERNIFPFQEQADVMFNSALIYELSVLKQYAEPLLFNISKSQPQFFEARRLIKFLDYFLGVSSEDVPNNSIIREFIGGSSFRK